MENVNLAADGTVSVLSRADHFVAITWRLIVQHDGIEIAFSQHQLCENPSLSSVYSLLQQSVLQPTAAHILLCEHLRVRLPNAFLSDGSLVTLAATEAPALVLSGPPHVLLSHAANEFVNVNAGEPEEEGSEAAKIQVVSSAIGASSQASNQTLVLLRSNYPSNMGHYLIDDIFASFVAARQFEAVKLHEPLQLIRMRSCLVQYPTTWYQSKKKEEHACIRLYQQWTPVLLGTRPISLPKNAAGFSPALEDCSNLNASEGCASSALRGLTQLSVRHLVVGIAFTSVRRFDHAAAYWLDFRTRVIEALNLTMLDTPMARGSAAEPTRTPSQARPQVTTSTQVIIFDKRRNAADEVPVRTIYNADALAVAIAQLPNLSVEVVDPSQLDLREQMTLLLRTDVLITPCGGISMLLGFLRPQSLVLVMDYWDPQLGSVGMEDNIWRSMHHLDRVFYPLSIDQISPASGFLAQMALALTKGKTYFFRNGINYELDVNLFVRMLQAQLDHLRRCQGAMFTTDDSSLPECRRSICWPRASSRSVDWRVCGQVGDTGSTVSEGICLPQRSLRERWSDFVTMMRMAAHRSPDVTQEMRVCASTDQVEEELTCKQQVATTARFRSDPP